MISTVDRDGGTTRPITPLGILTAKLQSLVQRVAADDHGDPWLLDELTSATDLASGLDIYIAQSTTCESESLASLAAATNGENWCQRFDSGKTVLELEAEMLSGHVEGQFLKLLAAATGARRVLEIGMFTGYSALAIAEGLPQDGQLIACEIDEYAAEFAQRQFDQCEHGSKIEVMIGPAMESLRDLQDMGRVFDLVFIDADKAGYIDYYQFLLDSDLLASNALICVDNTLLQGEAYRPAGRSDNGTAIAKFNHHVANDTRVQQVLIPLRDGVTLIRRVDR